VQKSGQFPDDSSRRARAEEEKGKKIKENKVETMWTASGARGFLLTVLCVFIAADVSASISFAPALLGCS
jgi:hypothetical protein